MPEAARQGDPIGHSLAGVGLIAGAVAGAAIGAAVVATGGAAALVIAGAAATGASLGGSLGQLAGTFAPPVIRTGVITGPCSMNVLLNNRPAARVGDLDFCSGYPFMPGPPHPLVPVAMGSAQIFINGKPAARLGDKVSCSAKIDGGSGNIIFGGGQAQFGKVAGEVPWQAEVALTILGLCGPVGMAAGGTRVVTAVHTGAEFVAGEAFSRVGDSLGRTISEESGFGTMAFATAFSFAGEFLVGKGLRGGVPMPGALPTPGRLNAISAVNDLPALPKNQRPKGLGGQKQATPEAGRPRSPEPSGSPVKPKRTLEQSTGPSKPETVKLKGMDKEVEHSTLKKTREELLHKDGSWKDPDLESQYQNYLKRKKKEGKEPRSPEEWKIVRDYHKFESPLARGNRFDDVAGQNYKWSEVHLGNGKRLDNYDPGPPPLIVSRKAVDLDDLSERDFEKYLDEMWEKYPPGTPINNPKNGMGKEKNKVLSEDSEMILEVPDSNLESSKFKRFEEIAEKRGIKLKTAPEE